jgi:alpha-tubulin suppressor-like RCC1 family protein
LSNFCKALKNRLIDGKPDVCSNQVELQAETPPVDKCSQPPQSRLKQACLGYPFCASRLLKSHHFSMHQNSHLCISYESIRRCFGGVIKGSALVLVILMGIPIHSACAAGGTVFAWGYNSFGACNVPSGLANVVEVGCGNYFSIALRADGTMAAWGDNSWGLANFPPEATNVMSISTRGFDCLALRRDGSLVTWGDNTYGQASIPRAATGVVAIATGGGHHLALRKDDVLVAWGANNYGQCNIPLEATNVIAIGAGYTHNLALRKDGHLVAWGENTSGDTDIPADATNIVAISVGPDFNLALRADGRLFAWGLDWGGNANVPSDATNIVSISAGEMPDFGIRADGSVAAWGRNDNGELNVPTGLRPAFSIAAGNIHSLAIRVTGAPALLRQPDDRVVSAGDSVLFNIPAIGQVPLAYKWRFNGVSMVGETSSALLLPAVQPEQAGAYDVIVQNGSGSVTSRVATLAILAAHPTITLDPTNQGVSLGGKASFGVWAKGSLPLHYQWQQNGQDLLEKTNETLSVPAVGFANSGNYRVIVTNGLGSVTSAVARLEVVPVFAWGQNQSGVLNLPLGLTNITALAAGQSHNLALKSDGTIIGWGDNGYAEITPVAGASNVIAVAAGGQFSLALRSDGIPVSWGNIYSAPASATNIVAIAAGIDYCLALNSNGVPLAWGWNTPTPPASATNLMAIAAGRRHSLGLRQDGSLLEWGSQASPPATVSNFIAIAAGDGFSVGLQGDGRVLAWGSNAYGQTNVPPEATNIVAIAAANSHVIAARDDGRVLVWGSTDAGQAAVPSSLTFPSALSGGSSHCLALMDTGPLRFVRQPLSSVIPAGDRTLLSATAIGSGTITYQWMCNGTNVTGATHAYLTITDTQAANAAGYAVVVANGSGSITSRVATITVSARAPVIVSQPASLQPLPSLPATFNVVATGTEPLAFQWYFNSSQISNANNSTLILTNAQVLNSGNYQVVITNSRGAVTSTVARLDIYPLNLLTTFTNANGSWSGAWGDFDNDGRVDLLVGGKGGGNPYSAIARLFRNAGNGSFVETNVGLGQSAIGAGWGDFDNDGALDILLTTLSDAKIYRNSGNGSFSNLNLSLTADYGTPATVVDFDRDGRLDLLLGGRLYRNLGGNRFTNVNAGLPSVQYGCTAWGDYDNDGWPDLLVCGLVGGGSAKVQLYRNLGNGTFTNVNVGFTNVYRGAVAWLDFNGDGKLDALVVGQGSSGVSALYRNNGDGTFTSVPCGLPGLSYAMLSVADFDNDGQPDVFLGGNNGTADIANLYRGLPSGLFTKVVSPMPTNLAVCAAWGDYDGDGRLDLATTTDIAGGQTTVGIFRNDTPLINSAPMPPTRLSAEASPNSIRFSWDPGNDSQTPTASLTYNARIGRTPGGTDVLAPNSDVRGFLRLPVPGNAGGTTAFFLTNLSFGQYYWSVQAVDSGFAGSSFSPEDSFTYACFTQSPTNVTSSEATLLGVMTANGFPSVAYFEWGTGTNNDNRTPFQYMSAGATNAMVSASVAGLLPGTSYSCRLVVTNQTGRFTGGGQSFTTINIPQIIPQPASKLSATGATLNALVNAEGALTTVYFEYGLSHGYGNVSAVTNIGSSTSSVSVGQAISGLIGGQVYHYHVVASNTAGMAFSAALTFATTPEPEVTTLAAGNIGPVSATLNGSVRPNTLPTLAYFEYGTTTSYGSTTATQALGTGTNLVAFGIGISNLTRVTTYHYRVVASNSYASIFGADLSFTTTNDVIALAATGIGTTNATLNALVNPNGLSTSVVFEYGLTTNYGTLTPPISLGGGSTLQPVSYPIGGLASGTNYYFRVSATNEAGGRLSSGLGFQTLMQFSVLSSSLAGAVYGSMAWGDYDNDGKLDMLVTDFNSTRIYRNLGGGSFATIVTGIPGVTGGSVAWGDYDNDGWLDILVTGTSSSGPIARIYRNNQKGSFSNLNATLPPIAFRTAQWGDFDNDGRPDVLLVGETNSVGLTLIYHNNGDGAFQDAQAVLPGFLDAAAACADYDNDGRLDVLLTGRLGIWYSNVFAKVFHNDGNGTFHEAPIALEGVRLGFADWGDFDGDGRLDLVIGGMGTGLNHILQMYHNNGDGGFTNVTGTLPQFWPDAALWGDYDNDGRADLLIRGQNVISSQVPSNSYSAVLRNNGDGTFTATRFPLPEIWSSCGGWADYNNNGLLDVAISGNSRAGAQLLLYQNNNPASNSPPEAPKNLSAVVSSNSVVFAWDKPVDGQLPGEALTYNLRIGLTPGGGEIVSASSASNGWRRLVRMGNNDSALVGRLSNLAPGKYYWSVQSVDAGFAGSAFAIEQSFTVSGPPLVLALAPTNVLATSAILRGTVFPNYSPTTMYFEWGTSTNFGNVTGLISTTNVSATNALTSWIAGLAPGSKYYFRAVASNDCGISCSQQTQFHTISAPGSPTISLLPSRKVQLYFTGSPGGEYHVLTSSNLLNWFDLGAAVNMVTNQFQFIESLDTGTPARFYRLQAP